MSDKRLGVLITCFNNHKTIIPALKSVLIQSKKPDLIVIADDFSSDSSVRIVNDFISKIKTIEIRLIARKKNLGVAANRDLAIRDMDVDFISTLDGDDLYYPGKLKAEWNALNCQYDSVAFSDILLRFEDKDMLLNTREYHRINKNTILYYLLSRTYPVPRDMMFSKLLYLEAEGFDHGVSIYEDWAFKIRLSQVSKEGGWIHSNAIGTIWRCCITPLYQLSNAGMSVFG